MRDGRHVPRRVSSGGSNALAVLLLVADVALAAPLMRRLLRR